MNIFYCCCYDFLTVLASEFGCNGDRIFLKSHYGKYIAAANDGTANANGVLANGANANANYDDSAKFTVIDFGSRKIGLRSSFGKYLVAESDKNVNANRYSLDTWEIFEVKYLGGVNIALKTHHGDFVVAKPDGSLDADVKEAGIGTAFTPECVDEA